MSHFKKVCEFGVVHSQCRCAGPHAIRPVKCDVPYLHNRPVKDESNSLHVVPDPEPEMSIYEALDSVLSVRLWWMKDSYRHEITQALERALDEL